VVVIIAVIRVRYSPNVRVSVLRARGADGGNAQSDRKRRTFSRDRTRRWLGIVTTGRAPFRVVRIINWIRFCFDYGRKRPDNHRGGHASRSDRGRLNETTDIRNSWTSNDGLEYKSTGIVRTRTRTHSDRVEITHRAYRENGNIGRQLWRPLKTGDDDVFVS